ncbi:hypothetical protein HOF92_09170, partial [bacterium]|nr:hypothetical protein [bacterium]
DSARVSGSEVNFEDTFTFSNAEATTITDAGGDAVTVNFAAGNITSSDMVDQLNTDFAANAVDVQASLDDDGNVVLNGANSGEDFTISGTSSGFSQATGLFDQNVNAAAGETASAEGLNNEQYVSEGISFDSTVSFTVQDGQSGAATQVDIGGAGTTSTRAELLDDINSQLEAGGQRVDARFTDAGELTFESRDVGNQSRVSVEDVSAGADTLRSTLAVSDRSDSGEGSTRFDLEVNSSDLSFQTGSNQGQSQAFSFGSFSSGALNLEDVDLQSQEGRDDFLGRVDGAIDRVSSARSSIGARENRFSSTFNRLSSSIRDSTATESSIRDSDLAIESIKLAQQQMKMKSALYAQTQMLDINKGFAAKIFG